jgi:hypothetical protein
VLAIYLTARLEFRLDSRVVFPAAVLATLLVADAWFDITTATTANAATQALILALAVELPAAAFSLYVACRVGQRVREPDHPGHVTGPQPPGPDQARKHPALPAQPFSQAESPPQE